MYNSTIRCYSVDAETVVKQNDKNYKMIKLRIATQFLNLISLLYNYLKIHGPWGP
jgi:hypothetical protein